MSSDKKIALDTDIVNQLNERELEYSTIIRGDGSPSYSVIENIYGIKIKGVIRSCSKIDTLSSDEIILPEFIQIGMNCK